MCGNEEPPGYICAPPGRSHSPVEQRLAAQIRRVQGQTVSNKKYKRFDQTDFFEGQGKDHFHKKNYMQKLGWFTESDVLSGCPKIQVCLLHSFKIGQFILEVMNEVKKKNFI